MVASWRALIILINSLGSPRGIPESLLTPRGVPEFPLNSPRDSRQGFPGDSSRESRLGNAYQDSFISLTT